MLKEKLNKVLSDVVIRCSRVMEVTVVGVEQSDFPSAGIFENHPAFWKQGEQVFSGLEFEGGAGEVWWGIHSVVSFSGAGAGVNDGELF